MMLGPCHPERLRRPRSRVLTYQSLRHLESAAGMSTHSRVTIVVVGYRRYRQTHMSYGRGSGTSILTGDAEMVVGSHSGRIPGAHEEWIDSHEGRCRATTPVSSARGAGPSVEDVVDE